MNRRRSTSGLARAQVRDLHEAWFHARRIGCPANVLLTFRPEDIDTFTAEDRCGIWAAIRNKLGGSARDHGFPFVAVWARETRKDSWENIFTC